MMEMDPSRSASRMASAAPTPPAELPMMTYLGMGSLLREDEGLIGAVGHTGGGGEVEAEVTFGNNAPLGVGGNSTMGAEKDTGPATDAFFPVKDHRPRLGVLPQGPGKTGKDTGGLIAMAAEDGDGKGTPFLDPDPRQKTGPLLPVGLDNVPGNTVLNRAVNLTPPAGHTYLFPNVYPLHFIPLLGDIGNRLPII